MSIWDELYLPIADALAMRLAYKNEYAIWSWIRQSDSKVGISIEMDGNVFITSELPISKYFEVSIKHYAGLSPMLVIVCLNSEFFDIFEVLCKDLIVFSKKFSSKAQIINAVKSRIAIWHELFKKDFRGLSKKEILGLAAELCFLKSWVNKLNESILGWEGPEGKPQDFVSSSNRLGVEVKVTTWTPSTIKISSLYQLDFVGTLYIAVYPIKVTTSDQPNAMNLRHLIEDVLTECPAINESIFESRLLVAGYIEDICNSVYFEIDKPQYYYVCDEFPKLIKSNVHDVFDSCIYELKLNKLTDFKKSEEELGAIN